MQPKLSLLTLDLGSSELKVSAYGEDGSCLSAQTSEIKGGQVEGSQAELNPDLLWRAVCAGICSVSRSMHGLRAASISSQGESFVPIDEHGRAIGNIILNVDARATDEMDDFSTAFGKAELYQITGLPAHPMYTLPKIAWLRKNQPAVFERAARFVCLEDYILHRLQVEPAISSSLASRTLGFDIRKNKWADSLLEFGGISSEQLSRVEPSGTSLGVASRSIASELGFPPELLWCSGGHDQACATIGSGATAAGDMADGTGTFECLSVPLEKPLLTETSLVANLPCERHAVPGRFLTLGYGPGGIVLKWVRDICNRHLMEPTRAAGRSAYDLMLQDVPGGPTGLFFFPYLLGTGTPWMDSKARTAILGLTSATTNGQLTKAALEGVTYEMCWNLEILATVGIRTERILAVGGGAKSEEWLQLKADIFDRPVVAVPGEASSRGAAICAAIGSGTYRNWDEAIASMVKPGKVFEPRPVAQRQYRELFEQYKEFAQRLYGFQFPPIGPNPNPGANV